MAFFFVVLSQLLGANVFASQRADSGKVYVFLRHVEESRVTAEDFVINKIGLTHHLCNLVRVEDETDENLGKKLSSTSCLVFLCSTAISFHYYPFLSNSLFFSRPLSGAGSYRYIVHRVLRI